MAGSNQWVMGEVDIDEARIENDEGVCVAHIDRTRGGDCKYRATVEQWQAIIDDIAMAPEVLACLREVKYDLDNHGTVRLCTMSLVNETILRAEPKRKVKVQVTVEVEIEDRGQGAGVVEYAATQVYTSPAVKFISKTATKA